MSSGIFLLLTSKYRAKTYFLLLTFENLAITTFFGFSLLKFSLEISPENVLRN